MKHVRASLRGNDGGAAAVEMAILAPLLILLVFGVIDVGRILFTNIGIQGAAQEGAMFGSFVPGDHAAVRQRVIESLESPELAPGDVTVSCPSADRIEVTVRHDLELLTPIVRSWFGDSITLERAVMGHVYSESSCGP